MGIIDRSDCTVIAPEFNTEIRNRSMRLPCAIAAFMLSGAAVAFAAAIPSAAPTEFPDRAASLPPAAMRVRLAAATEGGRLIFKNERIRLRDITLPAGGRMSLPAQSHYTLLLVNPGADVRACDSHGQGTPWKSVDRITRPLVLILAPGTSGWICSRDTKEAHLFQIEFDRTGDIPKILHMPWESGKAPRSTDGSDPRSWNPNNAAPGAAPDNHKLLYDSEAMRILSVTVPAHSSEAYHDHPFPSILVFDVTAKAADRNKDGVASNASLPPAPVAFLQAPQALHSIKNDDDIAVHLLRFEYKHGF